MKQKKPAVAAMVELPPSRFARGTIIKCKVDGCLRPTMIRKHGLCRAHYMRWWAGKPVEGPIAPRRNLPPYDTRSRKKKAAGR